MNKSYSIFVVKMWMSIYIGLVTMSSPPCMPDRYVMVVSGKTLNGHSFNAVPAKSV